MCGGQGAAWRSFYSNQKMTTRFSKGKKKELVDFCQKHSICVYADALWVKFSSHWIEIYPFRGFNATGGSAERLGPPRIATTTSDRTVVHR